ncbi:universal stress protein [Clavibacter sp. Sh2088]|uniref:universal stress protein n=1 Tax=Clavibacter sp. Sh2088 TaxID=3397676 RepID=UPI0039DFE4F3
MSARTPASPRVSPDRERAVVISASATALEHHAPRSTREHLARLAAESYDAIVAPGITVHDYLRNLVVHRVRGRLDEERAQAEAARPRVEQRDTRRVVVGFDGSPASESALDRAILIAGSLGVPVRVVVAWHHPVSSGQFPLSGDPGADARRLLDGTLAARSGTEPPTRITGAAVEGLPARVLVAESRDAQMLVVGSRGHGGFAGLLLGSVSAACAERAECPVLVMHAPRVEHEDPVSAGAEALGDGSRASDAPAWAGA